MLCLVKSPSTSNKLLQTCEEKKIFVHVEMEVKTKEDTCMLKSIRSSSEMSMQIVRAIC